MSDPMTPERLAQIRACSAPPFDDMATQIVYGTIQELLAEVDRLNDALAAAECRRDLLLKANLQLHEDVERVRLEVGGTRRAVVEWQAWHSGRASTHFGTDEGRARECVARENDIWGPGDSRVRSRLTFLGDWRDVEGDLE